MADRRRLGGDAGARRRLGEHGIDSGKHRAGGAEGFGQGQRFPRPPGSLRPAPELPVGSGERPRIGALETENRLFLVADGEQCARRGAGALAGKELLGQRRNHGPLRRARVLRLVDQQVVEAAIELVEHPGRNAFEGKQAAAKRDLIAIVEHGMTRLISPVEGEMTGCDLD